MTTSYFDLKNLNNLPDSVRKATKDEYIQIVALRKAIFDRLSHNITDQESLNYLNKNINFEFVINLSFLIKNCFLHMNLFKEDIKHDND